MSNVVDINDAVTLRAIRKSELRFRQGIADTYDLITGCVATRMVSTTPFDDIVNTLTELPKVFMVNTWTMRFEEEEGSPSIHFEYQLTGFFDDEKTSFMKLTCTESNESFKYEGIDNPGDWIMGIEGFDEGPADLFYLPGKLLLTLCDFHKVTMEKPLSELKTDVQTIRLHTPKTFFSETGLTGCLWTIELDFSAYRNWLDDLNSVICKEPTT